MPTDQDMQEIMEQFQRGVPMLQIVRECGIANPPLIEKACATLPEVEQIPILKTLVRIECGRIAVKGIETHDEMSRFIGVIECCRKWRWVDKGELDTILFEVQRWLEAQRDDDAGKLNCAEAALMRIAKGLSGRIF